MRFSLKLPVVLFFAASACMLCPANAAQEENSSISDNSKAIELYLAAQENLPVLKRSDWINVKTDVKPSAIGDGVVDDTAAIQAALSMLEGDKPAARTVYLPPGSYRITKTLSVTQVQGGAIYGHGRASKIVWDGSSDKDARMFHSNGFGRNLFFGLTFDGKGRAAVGVDHASAGYYETRVRYQYCAFRNFTDSGIRVGNKQKMASAEMMFYDSLFENCGRGISFLEFNDYDNSIARCVFRNCGSGVHVYRGNIYLRDSHFENSKEEDVLLPPHSHSIRRCSSIGSNAFMRCAQKGPYSLTLAVQDCLVENWKDPAGAVQLSNRGPILIFDSVFSKPANPDSPAVNLDNDPKWMQTLLTANLKYVNVSAKPIESDVQNHLVDIPRQRPEFLIEKYGASRWSHRPALPSKIFDAKLDFKAAGNGVTDDASAIQKTVDAAAAFGKNAQAYLPAGGYLIKKTINLGPGQYSFGGTIARRAEIVWGGAQDTVMIHANNTDGAKINQLFLSAPKDVKTTGLLVTADRKGSFEIDGIFAGGSFQPNFRGTVLNKLPSGFKVSSPHLDGELNIEQCGDATILLDYWFTGYDAPMTVSGPTGPGFIGINSAAGSHNDPDLKVLDSASIVIGDFYTEQTLRSLIASGKPGQPPGRITISYAKQACREPDIVRLDGYSGQVTVSRANMMHRLGLNAEGEKVSVKEKTVSISDAQAVLPISGGKDAVLLMLGNTYLLDAPKFEIKDCAVFQLGNNIWRKGEAERSYPLVPDTADKAVAFKAANVALDHFRELSLMNLTEFSK